MRSGVPRQRLTTLHATGGDGAIETADEQDEIDVGGEQLPVVAAGGAATQERSPRQQAEHLLVVECEPVADRDRLDTTSELHRAVSARRADLHQIGRANGCTPVTNAPLVCRLLLEKYQATYT